MPESTPLRLLAIRPEPAPSPGGDEIVYRRTIAYLERSMAVEAFDLRSVGRVRKIANILRVNPPEVTRFDSGANRRRLARHIAAGRYDAALFCNEVSFPMIPVVAKAGLPIVLTPHNLQSVVAASDPTRAARLLRPLAVAFERRWYGWPQSELVTISREDEAGLRAIGLYHPSMWHAPPGPPPAAPLDADAPIMDQAVLTGTFGWWRKRRDLRAFATGPAIGVPVGVSDPLALELLGDRAVALPDAGWSWSDGLRFGLVIDRFRGGFKLKSLEYVANNCAILSLADIRVEFEGLPYADEFVRVARDGAGLARIIAKMRAGDPQATVARFLKFKEACLRRFAWDANMEAVRGAVVAAASRRGTVGLTGSPARLSAASDGRRR